METNEQIAEPRFLGPMPTVSEQVKALLDGLTELQQRALLCYDGWTDEELIEDLQTTKRDLLKATPLFETPQRLMGELHVKEHDGTWYVVDGLSQIKGDSHYTKEAAEAQQKELAAATKFKLDAINEARTALGLDPIE